MYLHENVEVGVSTFPHISVEEVDVRLVYFFSLFLIVLLILYWIFSVLHVYYRMDDRLEVPAISTYVGKVPVNLHLLIKTCKSLV